MDKLHCIKSNEQMIGKIVVEVLNKLDNLTVETGESYHLSIATSGLNGEIYLGVKDDNGEELVEETKEMDKFQEELNNTLKKGAVKTFMEDCYVDDLTKKQIELIYEAIKAK